LIIIGVFAFLRVGVVFIKPYLQIRSCFSDEATELPKRTKDEVTFDRCKSA